MILRILGEDPASAGNKETVDFDALWREKRAAERETPAPELLRAEQPR